MLNNYIFIIIVCFSFLIFIFNFSLVRKNSLLRNIGHTFSIPLYFSIFFFLYYNEIPSTQAILFIEMVHMFTLLFCLIKKPNSNNVLNLALIYSIFVLLTGILGIYGLEGIYQKGLFIRIALVSTSVVNILILWLRKNNERGLINGLLWLLLSNVFILLVSDGLFRYGVIILRGISYVSIYCHFLKGIKKKIIINRNEADSLKASLLEEYNKKMEKQLSSMQLKQESLLISNQYDAMTKAYNKKAIIEVSNSLLSIVKKPMSILMIDIDDFKQINDIYGHIVGDNCIKNVVDIMQNSIRKADYIGRYGGDEFVVLLPNTSSDEAKHIGEKLRSKVKQLSEYNITISVGIACYPEDGNKTNELIEKADKGLYASKRKGKNSVSYIT